MAVNPDLVAMTAAADQAMARRRTEIEGLIGIYRARIADGIDPAVASGAVVIATRIVHTPMQLAQLLSVAVVMLAERGDDRG
jgi:hypothetical protein